MSVQFNVIKESIINGDYELVTSYDYSGYTSFEMTEFIEIASELGHLKIFSFFDRQGAPIEAESFIYACRFGRLNIIYYMLRFVINRRYIEWVIQDDYDTFEEKYEAFIDEILLRGLDEARRFGCRKTLDFLIRILPRLTNNKITTNDIQRYIDTIPSNLDPHTEEYIRDFFNLM